MPLPVNSAPVWQGKWLASAAPQDSVTVITFDDSGESVEFVISRSLLVGSSDWFDTALSGPWSETAGTIKQSPNGGTQALRDNRTSTQVEDSKVAGPPVDKQPPNRPSITFQDGPQALHDLLSYIHPRAQLQLRPNSVEPLLHLAEMVSLRGLVEQCGDFLCGKVSWDPVGTLLLAERYRLPNLYAAAGRILLGMHGRMEKYRQDLDSGTLEQLRRRHRAFLQEVALIAVKNILGRCDNRCMQCHHVLKFRNCLITNVLRAALATQPGNTHQLGAAVNHPPACDGGMQKLPILENGMTLWTDQVGLNLIDDPSAPNEVTDLFFWAARKVASVQGVQTVAHWVAEMEKEDIKNTRS